MNSLSANKSASNRPRLLIGLFNTPRSCATNFNWFLEMFSLFAKNVSREFVLRPPGCELSQEPSWLHEPLGRVLETRDPQIEPDYFMPTDSLMLGVLLICDVCR